MNKTRQITLIFLLLFTLLLIACSQAEVEPEAELVIPTEVSTGGELEAGESGAEDEKSEPAPPATPTPLPTITPDLTSARPEDGQEALPEATSYTITYVETDDTLNVRQGPGIDNDVVGELEPGESGIQISGSGQTIDGAQWVPIVTTETVGWVNSLFLSQNIPAEEFCADVALQELADEARAALEAEDGERLADLMRPNGRLHVRTYWWNPDVWLTKEEVRGIFTSDEEYDFGIADGTGDPLVGTFAEQITPQLEKDLVPATERGCNEILAGGTAGLVQLPPAYEGLNYVSFYRPAGEDQIEFDWGTWVIGFETFGGNTYLSFIVHYQWEI